MEIKKLSFKDIAGLIIGLLGPLTAIIGIVLSYIQGKRRKIPRIQLKDEFPFDIYTTKDLNRLKDSLIGSHRVLDYIPRLPEDKQATFEKRLEGDRVLLTGRSGLGKTRECLEAIERIAYKKAEDITILIPKEPFSPAIPPSDLYTRNVILFINDIHERYIQPRKLSEKADIEKYDFFEQLILTVDFFEKRFSSNDFRVIITAKDEPDLRNRLKLKSPFWNRFDNFQLTGIHKNRRREFIFKIANHFNVELDEESIDYIMKKGDGNPSGIITVFARENQINKGKYTKVKLQTIKQYSFSYPQDWEEKVYEPYIKKYPRRRAIFDALGICYKLRIPTYEFLIIALASYLWKGKNIFFYNNKIKKEIREKLYAWMFVFDKKIVCPDSLIEQKGDLSDERKKIYKFFKYCLRNKEAINIFISCSKTIIEILELQLKDYSNIESILKYALKKNPYSTEFLSELSYIYSKQEKHVQAIESIKKALEIDDKNAYYYIVLGYAYSVAGLHNEALNASEKANSLDNKDYFTWLNLGVVLSKQGYYERAIESIKKACELNPYSCKAYYSLGVIYDKIRESILAIEVGKKAVEIDPHSSIAWHNLGISYDKNGDKEEAKKSLEIAYELENNNPAILVSLGFFYVYNGQIEKGLDFINKSISCQKKKETYIALSKVYGFHGKREEAIAAAKEALAIDPKYVEALKIIAFNYRELGNIDEYINYYKKYAEENNSSDDWHSLSILYNRVNNYIGAVEAAKKAILVDSNNVNALRSLVINLKYLGRWGELIEPQKKIVERTNASNDWLWLSYIYRKCKRYGDSSEAAKRAIEISADCVKGWINYLFSLSKLSRVNEAINYLIQGLEKDPKLHILFYNIIIMFMDKSPKDFLILVNKLVTIDAENPQYWSALSSCQRKSGDISGSVKSALKSISLDQNNAVSWYVLGRSYEIMGDMKNAVEAFCKAQQINPKYKKVEIKLKNLNKSPGNN